MIKTYSHVYLLKHGRFDDDYNYDRHHLYYNHNHDHDLDHDHDHDYDHNHDHDYDHDHDHDHDHDMITTRTINVTMMQEKSLTICSGLDMVNINSFNIVCKDVATSQVTLSSSDISYILDIACLHLSKKRLKHG
jgi:hypothetical protein